MFHRGVFLKKQSIYIGESSVRAAFKDGLSPLNAAVDAVWERREIVTHLGGCQALVRVALNGDPK